MAIEQNITLDLNYFTGEDKRLRFQVYQSDEVTPQDITGWALSWMVKRRRTDPDTDALIVKTTAGSGIVLTTPVSGICDVTVTDDDIDEIVGGTLYFHELKRTDAGFETVLSYGTEMFKQAVHR